MAREDAICILQLCIQENVFHGEIKRAIETLLFELEKQDKQIKDEKEYHKMDLDMLQKYHKENSNFKYEIMFLKRQIDLMAEHLAGISIYNMTEDKSLILGSSEEVKEYFESKVKEEKRNDKNSM